MNAESTNLSDVIRVAVLTAQFHRALYEAYIEQGFAETEAIYLLGKHVHGSAIEVDLALVADSSNGEDQDEY